MYKMRVVVSFTTVPGRIRHLPDFILMLSQRICPHVNAIYFCQPLLSLKKIPYNIPEETQVLLKKHNITTLHCKDYGPITKLLPTLEVETDPDTVIVTIDDDVILTEGTLQNILHKARIYDECALSYTGWKTGPSLWTFEFLTNQKIDQSVDWIEGQSLIAYKRKFLQGTELLKLTQMVDWGLRHDDHILNWHLSNQLIDKKVIALPEHCAIIKSHSAYVDSISGNVLKFILEVCKISTYLRKKGVYGNLPICWSQCFVLEILFSFVCVGFLVSAIIAKKKHWAGGLTLLLIGLTIHLGVTFKSELKYVCGQKFAKYLFWLK